jgi:hypothetical protein
MDDCIHFRDSLKDALEQGAQMKRNGHTNSVIAGLGLVFFLAAPASAEDPAILEYADPGGAFSFSYPDYYKEKHEFPDGTDDTVGVRAEMASPDGVSTEEANIEVYSMEPRAVTNVKDENFEAYVEQFKKDFEPDTRIKFVSAEKTEVLGQLGANILFDQKAFGPKVYSLRIIATVAQGRDYFVRCVYSPGLKDEFAYHCGFAAESLKLAQ